MSDLVSRLRSFGGGQPFANEIERLAFEAAAEITLLQKELETAREDALEEAAKVAEDKGQHWDAMRGYESSACFDVADAIRALVKAVREVKG